MLGPAPGIHVLGGRAAAPINRRLARAFYAPIPPVVVALRRQGLSLPAIARELDRRGSKTRLGWDQWSATQVKRMLARVREATGSPGAGVPLDPV